MTNTTLERAARALWFERGGSWSDASDRQKQQCFYEARAVLIAVREPYDDTVFSAGQLSNDTSFRGLERLTTTHAAMIDAILNDGEGE